MFARITGSFIFRMCYFHLSISTNSMKKTEICDELIYLCSINEPHCCTEQHLPFLSHGCSVLDAHVHVWMTHLHMLEICPFCMLVAFDVSVIHHSKPINNGDRICRSIWWIMTIMFLINNYIWLDWLYIVTTASTCTPSTQSLVVSLYRFFPQINIFQQSTTASIRCFHRRMCI